MAAVSTLPVASAQVSDLPPVKTTVTVTGSIDSQSPASITSLDQQQLQLTPGLNLDDRLRQIPGFSLFRRSSSLVANPTTQGVSLRATGSSGASRTLVLWDSIPINDPFGGWVYWERVDPSYLDHIEVDRGGTTSVFGDRAFGGTISLFSPKPEKHTLYADLLAGSQGTADAATGYSESWGPWGLSIHSRALTTDGYYIVPSQLRGRVDDRANVRFATGDVHLDYTAASNHFSLRFDALAEARHNGTVLTRNSTSEGTLGTNYSHSWTNDQISFLGFYSRERFNSTYSSVSLNRNSETLTASQIVPAENLGGALYWQHSDAVQTHRWTSLLGTDVNDTHGTSFDYSFATRRTTPSGGTLLQHGIFGQGDIDLGRVHLFAGIRHQVTGLNNGTFVSPNGGMAVGWKRFRFRASGYRTLRVPSLNELYRQFRVGNALTLANPLLQPETLVGVEAGFDWSTSSSRISLTLFRNDLGSLITNTTLSTSPALILRQRTNQSAALSRGVEASVQHRWTRWSADASYLFADARVNTGQRIPQVPKQQGTATLTYQAHRTLISGGLRAIGLQYDDDLNQFRLPGFAVLQLTAEEKITAKLSGVATFDNLLDRSFLVALTPTPNTGNPRQWRLGLRWNGALF